ncbi:MAG: lipoprotein [Burkholderiaceae bacterium]|jgi:predicted small lipoprotein YifL|nr:lipoprotein [Burkholderiaceae bacterium]
MFQLRQILFGAIGLGVIVVTLTGCGQRGPLYKPTDPAAAHRATLPQSLLPGIFSPSPPDAAGKNPPSEQGQTRDSKNADDAPANTPAVHTPAQQAIPQSTPAH